MKLKPLKIFFETLEDFADRTRRQIKNAVVVGKSKNAPPNCLRFASVAAYQQIMSDQKYAILATVFKHNPQSIYQLAKILKRPAQNVIRDCKILEGHGFITYEQMGDARKTKAPKLAFDYNAIVIYMPSATYKVEFENDAA